MGGLRGGTGILGWGKNRQKWPAPPRDPSPHPVDAGRGPAIGRGGGGERRVGAGPRPFSWQTEDGERGAAGNRPPQDIEAAMSFGGQRPTRPPERGPEGRHITARLI